MMKIRRGISGLLSNFPYLFYFVKRVDLFAHYVTKWPFDTDFDVFSRVAGILPNPTIMDVGANIGQSAIEFCRVFPNPRIHSFEANPGLNGYLEYCKHLIGKRQMDIHMVGLSEVSKMLELYVPKRGEVFIYGEASLHPEIFDDPQVRSRIGQFEVTRQQMTLVDGDSLEFAPDIIKIDVQGHELSVLKGLKWTLQRYAPLLFIERSPVDAEIMRELESYGYQFFLCNGKLPVTSFESASERVNLLAIATAAHRKNLAALLM